MSEKKTLTLTSSGIPTGGDALMEHAVSQVAGFFSVLYAANEKAESGDKEYEDLNELAILAFCVGVTFLGGIPMENQIKLIGLAQKVSAAARVKVQAEIGETFSPRKFA